MLIPTDLSPYTAQQMADLIAAFDKIDSIVGPRAAVVPPDQANGFIKLGDGRIAAVPLVIQAALAHPDAFPPGTFDATHLQQTNEYRQQLDVLRGRTQSLSTILDDTRMVTGSEVITKTLQGYSQLQNAAKFMAGLKDVVKDIGEALRRKTSKPAAVPKPPAT